MLCHCSSSPSPLQPVCIVWGHFICWQMGRPKVANLDSSSPPCRPIPIYLQESPGAVRHQQTTGYMVLAGRGAWASGAPWPLCLSLKHCWLSLKNLILERGNHVGPSEETINLLGHTAIELHWTERWTLASLMFHFNLAICVQTETRLLCCTISQQRSIPLKSSEAIKFLITIFFVYYDGSYSFP